MITKRRAKLSNGAEIDVVIIPKWDSFSIRDGINLVQRQGVLQSSAEHEEEFNTKRYKVVLGNVPSLIIDFNIINQKTITESAMSLLSEVSDSLEILPEISQIIYDQWMIWIDAIVSDSYLNDPFEELLP